MSCSSSTSSSSPSTAPPTPKMYTTQHDIEQALVGSWSLIEYFSDPYDGKGPSLHPMGPDARGILTYHPDGCMSSRTTLNDGFMYTGEYWVELHERETNRSFVVCHRAEMASLLQLEGKVQRRQVTLPSRNRLVLSFVGFEDLDGLMVRPELMWERISRPCRAASR
ncbi:hypothetical protein BO99DRAFT_436772 [Aspergillus violaceofuscus CBS 115571]|uniref:Lipocalin-like domain-containing protein n=1 Tax=Aspergillus violaceofuscus (strain CBS 115571) TaxID=1450538 RepID=A0A2V5H2F4_ASPV1|nr:hypothetical protein BO99DRAFT_436772 [Aspergillus violaceofuscus CBS 115571]